MDRMVANSRTVCHVLRELARIIVISRILVECFFIDQKVRKFLGRDFHKHSDERLSVIFYCWRKKTAAKK